MKENNKIVKANSNELATARKKLTDLIDKHDELNSALINTWSEIVNQIDINDKLVADQMLLTGKETDVQDNEEQNLVHNLIIEKIKTTIIEMIHNTDELIKIKFSHYLSEKLNRDYTYLANIFSGKLGTTIEQFIITNKIERIKELMLSDKLNVTEISHRMNYSSVSHLSNQFKKNTGLSPSQFKKLNNKKRITPDESGNVKKSKKI